jgi:hypothetical protein
MASLLFIQPQKSAVPKNSWHVSESYDKKQPFADRLFNFPPDGVFIRTTKKSR